MVDRGDDVPLFVHVAVAEDMERLYRLAWIESVILAHKLSQARITEGQFHRHLRSLREVVRLRAALIAGTRPLGTPHPPGGSARL